MTAGNGLYVCALRREGRCYEVGYSISENSAFYSLDVVFTMPASYPCPLVLPYSMFEHVGIDMKPIRKKLATGFSVNPFIIFE
jgi:hypothetical protein